MATIRTPSADSSPRIIATMATISSADPGAKVTDANGQPAAGREVVVLGKNQFGQRIVVASALTDAQGEFAVAVQAGPNNPLAVVVLGRDDLGEYSRAMNGVATI